MPRTPQTLPRPFPHPPRQSRVGGLLLGTLLLAGGAASAQAQSWSPWRPAPPQSPAQRPVEPSREDWERQQAQALERMSNWQRRTYFQDRRNLERRQSDQRLSLLSQAERCLDQARGLQAIQACQQREQLDRSDQRRRQMEELTQLRQRYGLPLPASQVAAGGRWSPEGSYPPYAPYPAQPQPYSGVPQASGPSQGWPGSWLDLLFGF
ncbi:MAG: hypothetical protein ACKO5F_03195 [Synechococcus sp.]